MTTETNEMQVTQILMSEVFADEEFNCRGYIAPYDVIELAQSIEDKGLIQPVTVKPLDVLHGGYKFLLIAGYRRHKAHEVLKRTKIPCIIKFDLTDNDARFMNLSENIERKDLNILQEAKAISRLKELGISEHDTATELNKSRGWVQVRFMLLDLPEEIQQEAAAGFIKQVDIRKLFSLGTREERITVAKKIKEAKQRGDSRAIARAVPKKKTDKRIRKRLEIFAMMDHIQGAIGNGLFTRALSWAAGEISDQELLNGIKERADRLGIDYSIPNDGEY